MVGDVGDEYLGIFELPFWGYMRGKVQQEGVSNVWPVNAFCYRLHTTLARAARMRLVGNAAAAG